MQINKRIPFNKPFLTGNEVNLVREAIDLGKLSGNGFFTKKCQGFFQKKYNFNHCLLTHSCTGALEMIAILLDIKPGDEVIMPSFTFVSSANAFLLRGAVIRFCDSYDRHPNIDHKGISELINDKTKAIVVVHYGGVACNMDEIMDLANSRGIYVVEDAAQAIDSYYKERPLGSIGHMAAFSFHETKNLGCGEGGMLVVNDERFWKRAEIIWEKGTNRSAFWRGEVDKYNWVDIGSSFLPSEISAAFLYAQIEEMQLIQNKRIKIWNRYKTILESNTSFKLLEVPEFASTNGHLFAIILDNLDQRTRVIEHLKGGNVLAVFHYQSLHNSPFYAKLHDGRSLPNSDRFSDCLLRLPLYYELTDSDIDTITDKIMECSF